MGICTGSALFLQWNGVQFIYDLAWCKFLSAPVMPEGVFLRSFVSGNKLLLDKFMSEYGDNV